MSATSCPGCGVVLPDIPDGPTRAYMVSSTGCWAAFGELLAREFGDPASFAVHRLTVDTYAVQHPGGDARRQRQSVAVHLIGLCQTLELRIPPRLLLDVTRRLTASPLEWPYLEPPASYALTVTHARDAGDAEAYVRLVTEWADATWQAWSAHHGLVRRWADEWRGKA